MSNPGIYLRGVTTLRAEPQTTPDMTLYVRAGLYHATGVDYTWEGGTSPTFTAPTSPWRYDLLSLTPGNPGTLVVTQGVWNPFLPDLPTCPATDLPLVFVKLVSGQTTIVETDLYEARVPWAVYIHNLLSAEHGDVVSDSVVAGDVIIGNDTPKWSRLAISVPAANVRNVLGVDNGETIPSWKTALDSTLPGTLTPGATGSAGTSLVFSHRDHTHPATAVYTLDKAVCANGEVVTYNGEIVWKM